jgi:FdhD protein
MALPIDRVSQTAWRGNGFADGHRSIPEETAIAFSYDGSSYAVMMATPQDMEDFALGFSLTEAIVSSIDEIERLEIIEEEVGIELRMWLCGPRAVGFGELRRRLAGPTGCGLCGIESLAEAVRPPPCVGEGRLFTPNDIMRAMESVTSSQPINRETRAAHAAAFWEPSFGLIALRMLGATTPWTSSAGRWRGSRSPAKAERSC